MSCLSQWQASAECVRVRRRSLRVRGGWRFPDSSAAATVRPHLRMAQRQSDHASGSRRRTCAPIAHLASGRRSRLPRPLDVIAVGRGSPIGWLITCGNTCTETTWHGPESNATRKPIRSPRGCLRQRSRRFGVCRNVRNGRCRRSWPGCCVTAWNSSVSCRALRRARSSVVAFVASVPKRKTPPGGGAERSGQAGHRERM
jgi:hypothetical protein